MTNDYDIYAEKLAKLLRSGAQKPHAFIEKPAMQKLLPDLTNQNVLCAGCGTGEECGMLLERGAKVSGFDLSEKSVRIAQKSFPEASLSVLDMNDLSHYDDEQFDFIYSSLMFHYAEDAVHVLKQLRRILKKGGSMQFSVVHPVKWSAEAARDTDDENKKSFLMGYDTFQTPARVYGNYLGVTKATQKPQNYPEITYWNRPISAYFHAIKDAGLELAEFQEPLPTNETKQIDPEYWDIHSKIPQFMIFVVRK